MFLIFQFNRQETAALTLSQRLGFLVPVQQGSRTEETEGVQAQIFIT